MRMVLNGGKWVVKILTNGLQITTFFGEKKTKKKHIFIFYDKFRERRGCINSQEIREMLNISDKF